MHKLSSSEVQGDIIETGCALGGSAILLARCKGGDRSISCYDVFGIIPAPSDEDGPDVHDRYAVIASGAAKGIGSDRYYGYVDDLLDKVGQNFAAFGLDPKRDQIRLVKGRIEDTLQVPRPVALAHVDVDWYEPVRTSMERIWPKVVVGGVMVFDDYYAYSGCRKAVDEFCRGLPACRIDNSCGSLAIVKS